MLQAKEIDRRCGFHAEPGDVDQTLHVVLLRGSTQIAVRWEVDAVGARRAVSSHIVGGRDDLRHIETGACDRIEIEQRTREYFGPLGGQRVKFFDVATKHTHLAPCRQQLARDHCSQFAGATDNENTPTGRRIRHGSPQEYRM